MVTEMDGNCVEPYTFNSVYLHAAQRHPFTLHAPSRIDNYWVQSNPPRYPSGILRSQVLQHNYREWLARSKLSQMSIFFSKWKRA
ncbi:hypothetical protein L210DRAFT_2623389 [Boletus edulis BED1]|uniref:Plastocyanin-like domain-containing protein n=1 Tax=Boletus edulis BED1 TaxID=1328754 RepID=A0AAD4C5R2_BOLED|nr:hypothetical protein L210DRAFT_2623389 [Boletus edulis BED1]